MRIVLRGRFLSRGSERGAAAIVGAVAVAVVAGGVAGMIASGQKAQQRAAAAGVAKAHAQDANIASLAMLEKLFTSQLVVQRPWNTGPVRWFSSAPGVIAKTRYLNYDFSTVGPAFNFHTCNPAAFPAAAKTAVFVSGILPTLNACNAHHANPANFTAAMDPVVSNFQVQNNFAQNSFAVQVQAKTFYSPPSPPNPGDSVINQARFNLPPPQPFCRATASKTVVDVGEPVTVTIETVKGVQAAQWEAPYAAPGNPAGDSRVFTFPAVGNYRIGFRVTGLNGATPPTGPVVGGVVGPGIFPATNPPQARCEVVIRVPPCRFKTLGYAEGFNYPGHGNDIFGRGINTTGGSNCFSWPNCNNPGKISLDIPHVPGYGGAANWNWLPGMCLDPTKQCVNMSLACRCNTPLASMVIHDFNKQSCTVAFIMWRPAGGCFTPETAIQMADGSLRRVDSLRPGDLVWNPRRQEPSVVRRLYRGLERRPLYEIFAGGERIRVTELHVFDTPEGPRQAKELEWHGKVRLGSGEWATIDSLRTSAAQDEEWVWNVDLEAASGTADDHWLISDGLVTGDMVVQRQIKEGRR